MNLTGIRQKVFLDRYSLKNEAGVPIEKTPDKMWRRVSHAIAQVEPKENQKSWENKFYSAMEDGFIRFDKGGHHYQFDAKCRVIATANPKGDK